MSNAVILNSRNEVIALVETGIKSGSLVRYGYWTCDEKIDANREKNLVSAKIGKISRAEKYLNNREALFAAGIAKEINPGEFLVCIRDLDQDENEEDIYT